GVAGSGMLSRNQILNNHATSNGGAVWWTSSDGQSLSYNTLTGNTSAGDTGGIYLDSSYPRIYANRIENNAGYALYNNNAYVNTSTVVDARGNWWGPIGETAIAALIHDYEDPPYSKGPVDASEAAGPQQVDLTVSQSVASVVPAAGRPLTYTVTVRNLSSGNASGVQLQQRLPLTVSARSTAPSQGTCSFDHNGQTVCALGTIAGNQSATVTFVVEPQAPGSVLHTVTVRSTEPDTAANNDTASRSDSVYVAPEYAAIGGPTVGLYGASHTLTATVPTVSGAAFLGVDNATQGNWGGRYGRGGYHLPYWNQGSHRESLPAYVNGINYSNANFSAWDWNTSDNRAVPGQPDNSGERRVAFAYGTFDVLIDVSDNAAHEVTFYMLDWPNYGIQQRIDLLDPTTDAVLATSDTQSNFYNGRYVRFRFQGDIKVRFTSLGGWNAILNGIFFDGNANTIHPTLPLTYTWQAAGQAPV
ncbi:MAG: right-handed parallel beta-helix repeat-containing protein, partial [Caldilinea sp.]